MEAEGVRGRGNQCPADGKAAATARLDSEGNLEIPEILAKAAAGYGVAGCDGGLRQKIRQMDREKFNRVMALRRYGATRGGPG